ncbi:hypothetical protein GCWU000325_02343 [Alloprevotella tannerae ATCC 51259]|uniref:Uncharacterized protein n=1 Tax=Alloprevotella tannerae ATCC 51259 TaxID=626522 RepID=C9LJD1_9BACT|nr:hypothetical protein GCWU000325_02343 [Alloprevotella tannerae ATCC 51259]
MLDAALNAGGVKGAITENTNRQAAAACRFARFFAFGEILPR